MKKTLLLAALAAGFAGMAHAESSVTLYGLLDLGVGYEKFVDTFEQQGEVSPNAVTRIGAKTNQKDASYWGLKGEEALGNGTSVIFQLESEFNPDSGQLEGALFGRKAVLGLTSDSWGTLTVGRQYNAADDIVAGMDPFGTGWSQAGAQSTFGYSISAPHDLATLKYVSPSLGGFKFAFSAGHDHTKERVAGAGQSLTTQYKKTTQASLALGYVNGPVEVGASVDYERTLKDTVNQKVTAWTMAGAYDFDVVKLHLGYGQQHDGMIGGDDTEKYGQMAIVQQVLSKDERLKGLRVSAWFAGVSAPVGDAGKLIVGYQGGRAKNKESESPSGRVKTHIWSIGYQQGLSKRTHVYVLGSYGKTKTKGLENLSVKQTAQQAVVGLQHRF